MVMDHYTEYYTAKHNLAMIGSTDLLRSATEKR